MKLQRRALPYLVIAGLLLLWFLPAIFPVIGFGLHRSLLPFLPPPWSSSDTKALTQENLRLREALAKRDDRLRRQVVLEEENLQLRQALALPPRQEWRHVGAFISHRHPLSWDEQFIISSGLQDSLAPGRAVLINGFLAGRLSSVSDRLSQVRTLMSSEVQISVSIVGIPGSAGITQGGVIHPGSGRHVKIFYLPRDTVIPPGSTVVTSGLGLLPAGIPVGTIVSTTRSELNQAAVMRLSADLDTSGFVTVLTPQHP